MTLLEVRNIATLVEADVLVFKSVRRLPKGTLLLNSDIKQSYEPLNSKTMDVILTANDILGKSVSRTMSKGLVFKEKWVENVPVVEKGQLVSALMSFTWRVTWCIGLRVGF